MQQNINTWLQRSGYSVRVVDNPADIFLLDATDLPQSHQVPLRVERTRAHDQYIIISTSAMLGNDVRGAFNRMPETDKANFISAVNLELARTKMIFNQRIATDNQFNVEAHMPIANLTEDSFFTTLTNVQDAATEVVSFIQTSLNRNKPVF